MAFMTVTELCLTMFGVVLYSKWRLSTLLISGALNTVIYNICEDFQLDFYSMYACVGLWNTFFLIVYAVFDVSKLMKWCTRSTEEIFSLFISIAFAVDAGRDAVKSKSYQQKKILLPFLPTMKC